MSVGEPSRETMRNGPFVPLFERMTKKALPALNDVRVP